MIINLFCSRTLLEHIIKDFFNIPACILTYVRVVLIPIFLYLPRFVRREKEIAESRFEVAQGESLRYRLRVEHLERELKEVQDSLSATKERMQVCFCFSFYCESHFQSKTWCILSQTRWLTFLGDG